MRHQPLEGMMSGENPIAKAYRQYVNSHQTNLFVKGVDGTQSDYDVTDKPGGGKQTKLDYREFAPDNSTQPHTTSAQVSNGDAVVLAGPSCGTITVEKLDGGHFNLLMHQSIAVRAVGLKVRDAYDIPLAGNDGMGVILDVVDAKGKVLGTIDVRDETISATRAEPIINKIRVFGDDGALIADRHIALNTNNAVALEGKIVGRLVFDDVRKIEGNLIVDKTKHPDGLSNTSSGLDMSNLQTVMGNDAAMEEWSGTTEPKPETELNNLVQKMAQKPATKEKAASPKHKTATPPHKGQTGNKNAPSVYIDCREGNCNFEGSSKLPVTPPVINNGTIIQR
jgi:hypothetical protein